MAGGIVPSVKIWREMTMRKPRFAYDIEIAVGYRTEQKEPITFRLTSALDMEYKPHSKSEWLSIDQGDFAEEEERIIKELLMRARQLRTIELYYLNRLS